VRDFPTSNLEAVMTTSIIPPRQEAKPTGLGINASYNSRIVKLINKKKQLKSSVIIDELPTIYFRGLDNLIIFDSYLPSIKNDSEKEENY